MEESQQPPDDFKIRSKWSIGLSALTTLSFVIYLIISVYTKTDDFFSFPPSILSLFIPLLGVYSLRSKNSCLWGFFTFCNACEIVAASFYILNWIIMSLFREYAAEKCRRDEDYSKFKLCDLYCSKWFYVFFYISVILSIMIIIFSFLSCNKGRSITNHPYFGYISIDQLSNTTNQGGMEMMQFVTANGVVVSGIPVTSPSQQLPPQQPYNIVQAIPTDPIPPNSYVVNINPQPLIPEVYNSSQSDSSKVLLPPPSNNEKYNKSPS